MSDKRELPDLLTLPADVRVGKELIDAEPVRAIKNFLDCFDDDGRQVYNVPPFVLAALARIFSKFAGRVASPRTCAQTDF